MNHSAYLRVVLRHAVFLSQVAPRDFHDASDISGWKQETTGAFHHEFSHPKKEAFEAKNSPSS